MSGRARSFLLPKDERWCPGIKVKAASYRKVDGFRSLNGRVLAKAGSKFWLLKPESAELVGSHAHIKGVTQETFTPLLYACQVEANTVMGFAFSGGEWAVKFEQSVFQLVAQDDRVYVGTRETSAGPGSLSVLDYQGRLLWRHDYTERAFRGARGMPYHIMPCHEWGVVGTAFMEFFYLFDCRTGSLRWIVSTEDFRERFRLGSSSPFDEMLSRWLDEFIAGPPISWVTFNPRKPLVTIGADTGESLLTFDLMGALVWRDTFPGTGEMGYLVWRDNTFPGTDEIDSSSLAASDQNGRYLFVAGSKGNWRLYDKSGKLVDGGRTSESGAWAATLSDDGSWLSTCNRNNSLYVFFLKNRKVFSRCLPNCRGIGTVGKDLAVWDRHVYILEITPDGLASTPPAEKRAVEGTSG